jgi:hypothetical protein
MLDLLKVSALIKNCKIINNFVDQYHDIWQQIVNAKKSISSLSWLGEITDFYPFLECKPEYSLLAIDGSQIYPDRHEGFEAFLINIGTVEINYRLGTICCKTLPNFYPRIEKLNAKLKLESNQLIDQQRCLMELQQAQQDFVNQDLILLDGNYPDADLDCLNIIKDLDARQVPVFFYVSLSNSRDILKLVNCQLDIADRNLLEKYLPTRHYTTVFVQKNLPNNLERAFVYLNTGQEIVRVEFSAWLIDKIHDYLVYIVDQINKGSGYPVVLAEAHIQAVISNQDRFYFYKLIRLYHDAPNRSLKLQRKRSIAS